MFDDIIQPKQWTVHDDWRPPKLDGLISVGDWVIYDSYKGCDDSVTQIDVVISRVFKPIDDYHVELTDGSTINHMSIRKAFPSIKDVDYPHYRFYHEGKYWPNTDETRDIISKHNKVKP